MQTDEHTLVLRVNELFHDLEEEGYDDVHPEILLRERGRWQRLFDHFLPQGTEPKTYIDIGTGTGFVSSLLLPRLRPQDSLIATDISTNMLVVAKKKLEKIRRDVPMRFLKMNDERLDLPDASADVIMMNSVLHHIPRPDLFLDEVARVLKPGGLLFVGHEPNNRFFRNRFLLKQAAVLHALVPKRIAASILRGLGLYRTVVRSKADPMLDAINQSLLEEKLITHPLDRHTLSSLIDVHSPTAGGIRTQEGFDPQQVAGMHGLSLLSLETYNHLLKMSGIPLLKPYELLLSALFPRDGAGFFMIAAKQ